MTLAEKIAHTPSKQELKYLSWQTIDKTWRQFYEELYGISPLWRESTQYGGEWLDKKMNEPIPYENR